MVFNLTDKRMQERIAEKFVDYLDDASELVEGDKSYVAYLSFCILGSGLLQELGEERFDSLVQEIKEKSGEVK